MISGCKKDEDKEPENTSANGSFTANGTSYSTPKGYIVGPISTGNGSTGYYFMLVSNSINCAWSDEVDDVRATGTGNIVTFMLWSSSGTKPLTGTYTLHDPSGYPVPFEYDTGGIGVNYNCTNEEGTFFSETGGTITLSESGTSYNLTYSFSLEGGYSATGNYNGSLQSIVPPTL